MMCGIDRSDTIESHVAHDHDQSRADNGAYDFAAIQAKWLPVWDELQPFPPSFLASSA